MGVVKCSEGRSARKTRMPRMPHADRSPHGVVGMVKAYAARPSGQVLPHSEARRTMQSVVVASAAEAFEHCWSCCCSGVGGIACAHGTLNVARTERGQPILPLRRARVRSRWRSRRSMAVVAADSGCGGTVTSFGAAVLSVAVEKALRCRKSWAGAGLGVIVHGARAKGANRARFFVCVPARARASTNPPRPIPTVSLPLLLPGQPGRRGAYPLRCRGPLGPIDFHSDPRTSSGFSFESMLGYIII